MPKLVQRLIIFFIGMPLVLAFVIPPFFNHLTLHLLLLVFSFLAAAELSEMLSKKSAIMPKAFLISMSVILPVISYLCGFFNFDFIFVDIAFACTILFIFAVEALFARDFEVSNQKISNAIFCVSYAGFLPTFISRLSVLNHSSELIVLFLLFVFISDSAAWLFGMTLGKNNRGLIAASPNKSIAGFIGAYLGTGLICVLLKFVFWKEIFGSAGFIKLLILAVCVTTASIIGDLAESVFKRSSGCKDSGNIILGRGGALDSIDSIFGAAPVFYIIVRYIFN
ncbi:MAG: phosphatidate cytidylyltransferase [Treponema sp.]|nr:phosphatidate cytidylyltransferase [Candidatus Treponema merdequi]